MMRKSPLFGLCYTELPHSRFAVPCFCYPFDDFSNLGKSLIKTGALEFFPALGIMNVKQA